MTQRKPIIGLAGGIGAGKSEVARVLASLGAGVIDSDELNEQVLNQPEVVSTIRTWWGDEVIGLDGQIDRQRLAGIVFSDDANLRRLEKLQHPRIAEAREALIEQYQADPSVGVIVLDSPLLFEVGLDARCNGVIFVEADRDSRLERVQASRNWDEQEFSRRENLQIAVDTKREKSDYIVKNNSNLEVLRQRVEDIFSRILSQ